MTAPLGLETKAQRGIFVTYMGLWVSYGLLNELAKRQSVRFNSACAVVVQSMLKLLLASYMYVTSDTQATEPLVARLRFMWTQAQEHRSLLLLYFIPSGLYVVYDVLSYVNLRAFDAATYFLLLQFRLVVTGVLHQMMFSKRLNRNQWVSLGVTTVGCAIKTLGSQDPNAAKSGGHGNGPTLMAYGMLMVQMLSSTFAGVYNEVLLKKQASIPVNLQNVFMYIDSIVCTLAMLALGLTGQTAQEALTTANFSVLLSPYVLPMVLIMSVIGVVTSLFLKQLDSIRKAIASALELVFLPLLSAVLFGQPITLYTMAAVCFVGFGVYIYSLPVESTGLPQYTKVASTESSQDKSDE
ncbi:Drug/Metabolite Transporter [Phytophthora megakarya]|uniref:Drug/Metabolite Transporter n=1 Tax=Phytophthora megakarya TaxID=4795 RepID=A0A225WXU9_9STRA|nr:Drug/Metabolite Transporter [Phytophthora megakarya]